MARFNQNVYNHIKAVGGSEASAQNAARAKKPGRALRRFLDAFTPPSSGGGAPPAPPPMPQMSQYRAPTPTNATLGAMETGVRRPKRERTTLASLRIRPKRRINQSLTVGSAAGSGLNIGGF